MLTTKAKVKSVLWIMLWALAFATSMSLVKLLYNTKMEMVVFVRFLFGVVVILPVLGKRGGQVLKTERTLKHLGNSIFRVLAVWATYYAYANLPLTVAVSVGFTGPVMAIILAILLLKERVPWGKWVCIFISYLGVLIIVRPEPSAVTHFIFVALLANFASSFAKILSKDLSNTDSAITIMFYANTFGLVLSGLYLCYFFHLPPQNELIILGLVGVAGTLSQYSYLQALYHGSVSFVAPYEYTRLVVTIPVGVILFAEIPTSETVIGAGLIVATSVYLTIKDLRAPRPSPA